MLLPYLLRPTHRNRRPVARTPSSHHQACKSKQDAQLSQRDRAAGCVIVFAKSTLELGDNDLRTL